MTNRHHDHDAKILSITSQIRRLNRHLMKLAESRDEFEDHIEHVETRLDELESELRRLLEDPTDL